MKIKFVSNFPLVTVARWQSLQSPVNWLWSLNSIPSQIISKAPGKNKNIFWYARTQNMLLNNSIWKYYLRVTSEIKGFSKRITWDTRKNDNEVWPRRGEHGWKQIFEESNSCWLDIFFIASELSNTGSYYSFMDPFMNNI